MPTISVQTTPSYPILIERGLLRKAGQTLLPLHPPCRAALLSDDTVFSLYGRAVMDSLEGAGYRPVPHFSARGGDRKNLGRPGRSAGAAGRRGALPRRPAGGFGGRLRL